MQEVKPSHILLFLLANLALLGLLGYVFPKEGIVLSEQLTLRFPDPKSLLKKEEPKKPDISKIIALADAEEEVQVNKADTAAKKKVEQIKSDTAIQLNTSVQTRSKEDIPLQFFFDALQNLSQDNSTIRILHYGDSQIEGDRISDYLRMKLQQQFGGSGPGFIPAMPVTASVGIKQSWSEGWDRYTMFTMKDKRVKHLNYGVAAGFCRFLPYRTISDTSNYHSAWLKVSTNKNGGDKLASYTKVKLFYGDEQRKTAIDFYENGILRDIDSLLIGGTFNVKEFKLKQSPENFEIRFKGKDSPDVYGLSLEGEGGVQVDNFALRGSSGTFFNQMNLVQLQEFYNYLNVKLIIMQFGGNALPAIKDSVQAANYGRYLQSQINTLRKLAPGASVLVIGPADMSVKEGENYVTHPQLENLRDAIRRAAFHTNSAFFDMYDCMGGRNSMLSWVEAGIAAKDYIHFSSGGARKIATLLYNSIMNDYNKYIETKQANP